ncbi:hypothetical protein Tco_0194300 [Tanacetum coccineum]
MKLEQFQVNTKFLNSLPPEWSKFVTDVKLVRDLHTTNFDQLHAYLEQHELHANEVWGRQCYLLQATSRTRANILRTGTCRNNSGQQRVVKCFNCQGEGPHGPRTVPKDIRGKGMIHGLDLEFAEGQLHSNGHYTNVAYQADDFEWFYDSDCDDFSTAKAVLMANLSSYGSNVLSEVNMDNLDCLLYLSTELERKLKYIRQMIYDGIVMLLLWISCEFHCDSEEIDALSKEESIKNAFKTK